MSTVCCLSIPSTDCSLILPSFSSNSTDNRAEPKIRKKAEEETYSIILNQRSPFMTHSNNLPRRTQFSQQQQQQSLLFVGEEAEILDYNNQNDNDKLLLPRSTRSLKRRTSLLEKSRDWVIYFKKFCLLFNIIYMYSQARRLINLHRTRRNATSNEKIDETCYRLNDKHLKTENSYHESLCNYLKSLDEDGYLSPMEIKAKVRYSSIDNI